MDTKTIVLALVVVLALGVFLPIGKESRTVVERLGDVNSPDLNIGGMRLVSAKTTSFTQATSSVICSLQSPAATSTLVSGSVETLTGTSSATSLTISRGTSAAAVASVSTTLASSSVAATAYKTLVVNFSSTTIDMIFPPSTYFLVTQSGGGVMNQSGACQALWQVTN